MNHECIDPGDSASRATRFAVPSLVSSQFVLIVMGLLAMIGTSARAGQCDAPVFFIFEVPQPRKLAGCKPFQDLWVGHDGSPSFHIGSSSWSLQGSAAGSCKITVDSQAWNHAVLEVVDEDPEPGTVTVICKVTPVADACPGANWPEQELSMDFEVEGSKQCSSGSCGADEGGGGGGSGGGPRLGGGGGWNRSGPSVEWSLGMHDDDHDAGILVLRGKTASAALAQPSSLALPFSRSKNTVIPSTGTIEQIKSPQGLVRVVDTSPSDSLYDLEFFYHADVYWDGSRWQPNMGASPFVKWTIKNPSGNVNILEISEYHGAALGERFTYTYNTGTSKWSLSDLNNVREVVSWETISGSTTDAYEEIKSGSTVVAKARKTLQTIDGHKVLTQLIEGDGGTTRTTTYTRFDSGAAIGRAKRIDYFDGRWEMFEYDSDRRLIKHYEAFLDMAPPAGSSFPSDGTCKVTEYDYTPVDDDDVGIRSDVARTIFIKIPVNPGSGYAWTEVGRTYRSVIDDHTMIEQVCADPGAAWDASGNQQMRSINYTEASGPRAGRVKSQEHANGTATVYDYLSDANGTSTLESTGSIDPNASGVAILDGTRTETAYDTLGRISTRTTKRISAGQVTSTILAQDTFTYESFDPLGRDYHVVNLAGRTNFFTFECCGLESYADPDDAVTNYEYDGLGRQVAAIRFFGGSAGIKTTNVLDVAGRVLATIRIATNGTSVTQSQYLYDVLGRVTKHTNALGGETVYSESVSNNKLQRTITNPDGGTRIETYYRDGRLEKVTGTAVSGVRYVYGGVSEGGVNRQFIQEIQLDASGNDSSEWVKTFTDGCGNDFKVDYADGAYERRYFNNLGQLWKSRDPDNVITLFAYNAEGEQVTTAVSLDQDDTIDRGGAGSKDRIRDRVITVTNYSSTVAYETDDWVYTTDASSATNLVAVRRASVDGLKSWNTVYKDQSTPVTTTTLTAYGSGGLRTNTVTAPDGSSTVSIYSYGRLTSVTGKDAGGGQVSRTTYAYDPHGRVLTSTDARNGATSYAYNAADQPETVTLPPPGDGSPAQVTTTSYDTSQRAWKVIQPDGTAVTNQFHPSGLLKWTFGSRTYPVQYGYSPQGRMTSMKTYQQFSGDPNSPGTAAETTWVYHSQRGWLVKKLHPGETDTTDDYTYTAGGRIKTRVWERGITTTYKYGFDDTPTDNQCADLVEVLYSDSTPSATYGYDRRGRRSTSSRNSIATTLTYNDSDQLLTETYSGGTLSGLSVNNAYNAYLQRTTVEIKNGSTVLQGVTYAYDTAGRLGTVTDASATAYTAVYAYHPNSALVNTLSSKQSGVNRLVTTRSYDWNNRLTGISSVASGGSAPVLPFAFGYQYNAASQRTRMSLADSSYWVYEYDKLGQVTSGNRYWADATPVAGQQFSYAFDDIGNRTTTGGRASAVSTYTRNALNQYTQRTVAGTVDVLGVANPMANVTVNGNVANRRGEYFHWPLTVANSSAQYPTITVVSQYGGTQTDSGEVFVPASTETYSHDTDGNLYTDGRWTYSWDGENRLIEMKRDTSSPTLSSRLRLTFEYDHQGRRIRKQFYTHNGSTWVEQTDTIFLYDGWNLMGELDANASNAKLRTYVWGTDLSGSNQGAGGVGGLLKVTDYVSGTTHHFVAFDGNGNVSSLVDGSNGATTARYEYGPFGEPLRTTGGMGRKNPHRFSTKYSDDEAGVIYFGFRYYAFSTGRWLSRDPIGEHGGLHLYGALLNCPIDRSDPLGLSMTRSETFQGLQTEPKDGEMAGWQGATYWAKFAPKAHVYPYQCCFRIHFRGHAHLVAWWVRGVIVDGVSSQDHEMVHVGYHRQMFDDYNGYADSLAAPCYVSRAQANCYKNVILGELLEAYAVLNAARNFRYDCTPDRPKDCEAADKYERLVQPAFDRLSQALMRCNQL